MKILRTRNQRFGLLLAIMFVIYALLCYLEPLLFWVTLIMFGSWLFFITVMMIVEWADGGEV